MFIRILSSVVSGFTRAHQKAIILPTFLIAGSLVTAVTVYRTYNTHTDHSSANTAAVQSSPQQDSVLGRLTKPAVPAIAAERTTDTPPEATSPKTDSDASKEAESTKSRFALSTAKVNMKPSSDGAKLVAPSIKLTLPNTQSTAEAIRIKEDETHLKVVTTKLSASEISISVEATPDTPKGTYQIIVESGTGDAGNSDKQTIEVVVS